MGKNVRRYDPGFKARVALEAAQEHDFRCA
jgi:hypothetical protein